MMVTRIAPVDRQCDSLPGYELGTLFSRDRPCINKVQLRTMNLMTVGSNGHGNDSRSVDEMRSDLDYLISMEMVLPLGLISDFPFQYWDESHAQFGRE